MNKHRKQRIYIRFSYEIQIKYAANKSTNLLSYIHHAKGWLKLKLNILRYCEFLENLNMKTTTKEKFSYRMNKKCIYMLRKSF